MATPLHALDWSADIRTGKPQKYTVPPEDAENRFQVFLQGWLESLTPKDWKSRVVNCRNLGRAFGSVLGDVGIERQRAVFAILLLQFVSGRRCKKWTAEDRSKALGHFGLTPG